MFSDWHFTDTSNFITDVVLAIFLFFWGEKLNEINTETAFVKAWSQFFYLLAASAFVGGWGHLLGLHVGIWGKWVSWQMSMIAVLVLEIGLLKAVKLPREYAYLAILKGLVFSTLLLIDKNYNWVKMDMTIGLLAIIIPILYMFFYKTKNQGFGIIIGGLLANGLAGAVHTLNINLAPNFDRSDLAHVISIICFGIVFFGLKYLFKNEPLSIFTK